MPYSVNADADLLRKTLLFSHDVADDLARVSQPPSLTPISHAIVQFQLPDEGFACHDYGSARACGEAIAAISAPSGLDLRLKDVLYDHNLDCWHVTAELKKGEPAFGLRNGTGGFDEYSVATGDALNAGKVRVAEDA